MSPRSGKLYLVNGFEDFEEIAGRLDGFSVSEKYEDGSFNCTLIKDIQNLSVGEDSIRGYFCYDFVMQNKHRGKVVYTPVTKECPFYFGKHGNNIWLLVLVSKQIANRVAVELGGICNIDVREGDIYSREMNHYVRNNDNVKVAFFEQLDIPGINSSSIYGVEFVQTQLFGDLKEHGIPKWIVTESALRGFTVGLGGDVGVTIYNNVEEKEFVEFVEEDVLPLVYREVRAPEQTTIT